MTSNADSGPASGNGPVGVSGPTRSLWLRLLALSSLAAAAGLVLCSVAAVFLDGVNGALSAALGGLLVMLFFEIGRASCRERVL